MRAAVVDDDRNGAAVSRGFHHPNLCARRPGGNDSPRRAADPFSNAAAGPAVEYTADGVAIRRHRRSDDNN